MCMESSGDVSIDRVTDVTEEPMDITRTVITQTYLEQYDSFNIASKKNTQHEINHDNKTNKKEIYANNFKKVGENKAFSETSREICQKVI